MLDTEIEKTQEEIVEPVENTEAENISEEAVVTAQSPTLEEAAPAELKVELSEEEKAAAALELKLKLEGLLFASDQPLSAKQLRALFPEIEAPTLEEIRSALAELQKEYEHRGVHLVEIGSGYCFRATKLIAPYVGEMMGEKTPRYSRAFLETLAIIAYRQPITRGEIEQIRGVAVNSQILKTLQEREWIKEVGFKEVPGKPALLATTKEFLDYFHLKQLSDLPPLAELLNQDAQMAIAEEQIALAIEENTSAALEPAAEEKNMPVAIEATVTNRDPEMLAQNEEAVSKSDIVEHEHEFS